MHANLHRPRLSLIALILIALWSLFAVQAWAEDTSPLRFGVVPQQSASRLAALWVPLLTELEQRGAPALVFRTAPDIPTFERRLAAGEYDLAYMNPYHYTVFSQSPGYRAFAKARDQRIQGILVTRRDSDLTALSDLEGADLAFPSPAAFAASILTRANLASAGVSFQPHYVSSHDSVYRGVAKGLYPAGGGVVRTFESVAPDIREQLRIFWTSDGYTPHAFAAHPRLSEETTSAIATAMIGLSEDETGRALLEPLRLPGLEAAEDADWDDVRALDIQLLDDLIE
ncbi:MULTISPECIES: phosphate/phosphite/phosphonate ABC transporter substrate-binding protein [Thiorhodovibrio]|uniref:phosphate/phosphite/phosphonate ABC transporter substrate-binding protein n=1 Tax=Thiorhodovibrio TaxID=61593 RepID=UPI001912F583|nr:MULTISPECIES: phosphate/phosphite/phosphonate ABC transporter substrate-binding protein [Thiorhodovibrio]MBK5969430.1 phosphate ABC transporter substrate-binding protein [Thiorhodovibrio winogradskyi]WPL11026.1 Phosphate-import protein PhnD precursor [Thiorhodovibrio litoralis]